jgi:hypothetical protein
MPATIYGSQNSSTRSVENLQEYDFGYEYPNGLDLKPHKEDGLHDFLVDRIMERARAAHEALAGRRRSWDEIDEKMNVYIPLDAEEERIKENDPRKPVSVVVPVMYANRETLCTYAMSAFFGEAPTWPLVPRNPNSVIGAIKLEMWLEWQRERMAMMMPVYTQISDAWTYGFGAVTPSWHREMGFQTVRKPKGFLNRLTGFFRQTGFEKERQQVVNYEGNRLDAINPRHYLPDPHCPVHDPDRAEFVGWMERTNLMELLNREQYDGSGLFNCQYGRLIDGRSTLYEHRSTGRDDDVPEHQGDEVNPADIIWMHVQLIPEEWHLGPETYPERWLFGLLGDKVIVQATRLGLDHNKAPVAVAAPDTDGRAVAPISKVETGYGLQVFCDWMFNAHAENKRRAIYNQFVYDPSVINSRDIRNPKAGGLIRTRRAMWGRDLKTAIMQLPATDVTKDHVSDVAFAMDLMQRTMGTVDIVQGIMRQGGERRSATEARGAREGALSRLQLGAKLISEQSMKRLGYLMAKQTQQLASEEIALRITGPHEQSLAMEYGYDGFMVVDPFDVLVDFDVLPRDGSLPNSDNADIWLQMIQMVSANPVLSMRWDVDRMLTHLARIAGATNAHQFKVPNIKVKVMEEAMLQSQVDAGNMAPADEVASSRKEAA